MLKEIKYWIADKLFEAELDDAYAMGIRMGQSHAISQVRFQLNLENKDMTKTQAVGYARAIEVVGNVIK